MEQLKLNFDPSLEVEKRNTSKSLDDKVSSTTYIKSPLNYVGGKHKLLPQIMPLFPKNINTFVDLFSGGANVGIGTE